MNQHDLHDAFDRLARREAEEQSRRLRAGSGLSAEEVAAGARRHRARRATVGAVVGLVVLGGVAFGATALDRPAPPQPAAPSPSTPSPVTPSPTPSPDPAPVRVLATGDPSLPLGACGSLVGAPSELPVDDRWTVAVGVDEPEIGVGHALAVSTRMDVNIPDDWAPTGIGHGAYPGTGPEFLVLHDGVVVGTTDLYGDIPAPLSWYTVAADAHSTAFFGSLPLTSCADGGSLPAGEYELVGTMPVLPLGDDDVVTEQIQAEGLDAVVARRTRDWRRAVSTPLPFRVAEDGVPPAVLPAPVPIGTESFVPSYPVCGQPSTPPSGPVLTITARPPTSMATGSAPDVPAWVTYVGPGRLHTMLQTTVGFWALQDGVVVADTSRGTDTAHAVADLGQGTEVPVAGPLDLTVCGAGSGGGPLGPGTYTVVPVIRAAGSVVRTDEGVRDLSTQAADAVTGEPFTLVVE
jgi:hypothetical protein